MPHLKGDVVVVGDGPTGLSAALLLAKNGLATHVLGVDETPMHKALLHNYLGRDGVPGGTLMHDARRQCERYGAKIHRQRASSVERLERGFVVVTGDGNSFEGRYLVLANGRERVLAEDLGLELGPDGVVADLWGRTGVHGVYAGGWLVRGARIQAAISVGDGAAIALDILSREKGKPFHDFDTVQRQVASP